MPVKPVRRALNTSIALASVAPALLLAASAASASGSGIVDTARANVGDGACSTNSAGGTGFYSSCTGNFGTPEAWCADFAKWVWSRNGVNVAGLTPAAGSFGTYNGGLGSTPHVGDAVVFNYNGAGYADHVAIVASVGNGTITTIGGNEGGVSGNFSATSRVKESSPFNSAVGSAARGQTISGYVSPIGGSEPTPPAETAAVNVQLDIAGSGGSMLSQFGNYEQGRFNPNWTDVGGAALTKVTSTTVGDTVHFYGIADGRVYGRDHFSASNTWTPWAEIPGGASGVKDIAASSNGKNVVLSVIGGDGVLYTQYGNYEQGHFDQSWIKRNGVGLTSITSVSGNSNTIRIYAVGSGGRVYGEDFTLSTNSVGEWGEIPGGVQGVKDIAASANGTNVVLSIAGADGVLYTQYGNYDKGHFDQSWIKRNGVGLTNVTSVTGNSNTIRIYAVGGGGRVYGEDFTLSTNSVSEWGEIPGGAAGAKDITASMSH
ncbi:CHAP domain-containing protein [Streptomyces sp. NPDC059917]|uniref:CHAP domain-containing protein n=1 Tax=Streptomyces sp. NPDC059917 TaxID=3347002 RepID=UPI00365AA4E7